MVKYRILIALLSGAGVSSLLLLLLGVSRWAALTVFLTMFLLPGAIVADVVLGSKESGLPLGALAANAFLYSAIAYGLVSALSRNVAVTRMRLATIRLAAPVAILVALACVPALNPLWPRGMTELAKEEEGLHQALPLGMGLDGARTVLRSRGIQFYEQTEASEGIILEHGQKRIIAYSGDRVISARVDTEASDFPCGYRIDIVLLFGQDNRMKQQYIQRFHICP